MATELRPGAPVGDQVGTWSSGGNLRARQQTQPALKLGERRGTSGVRACARRPL